MIADLVVHIAFVPFCLWPAFVGWRSCCRDADDHSRLTFHQVWMASWSIVGCVAAALHALVAIGIAGAM